jgi:hypothetical protein
MMETELKPNWPAFLKTICLSGRYQSYEAEKVSAELENIANAIGVLLATGPKDAEADAEVRTLQFGSGMIAVTVAHEEDGDMVLSLSPNHGSGPIGSPDTHVAVGDLLEILTGDVVLRFSNPESLDVVIEDLIRGRERHGWGLHLHPQAPMERDHRAMERLECSKIEVPITRKWLENLADSLTTAILSPTQPGGKSDE